jgi:hypothetical protein
MVGACFNPSWHVATVSRGQARSHAALQTCLGCANFVVDEHHRNYWQDRRRRNETLFDKATALTRAVLHNEI